MLQTLLRIRYETVVALASLLGLSFVIASWAGVLCVLLTCVVTFAISALPLRDFYQQSTLQAILQHFKLTIGIIPGLQIIEDGKMVVPSGKSLVMGPRTVIIKPYNAVIFESGPRQTEITGPRVFTSKPFEYMKRIIELRDRQKHLTFTDVLSADLMRTTIRINVVYALNISAEARRGERPLNDDEKKVLSTLDLHMGEWETETVNAIERSMRRAASSYSFDDLLRPKTLSDVERDALAEMRADVSPWGVEITHLAIQDALPDQKLTDAREKAEATRITDSARAQAMADALNILAPAFEVAKNANMTEDEIKREVVRRSFEQMSSDPNAKFAATTEMTEFLSQLR